VGLSRRFWKRKDVRQLRVNLMLKSGARRIVTCWAAEKVRRTMWFPEREFSDHGAFDTKPSDPFLRLKVFLKPTLGPRWAVPGRSKSNVKPRSG